MNKPPPTVFKQIPLQLTQPPLVMVLISAKPRPNLFRIGTMNGPTTGILDAASEIIPLPTTSPLPTPAPELLLAALAPFALQLRFDFTIVTLHFGNLSRGSTSIFGR